MSNFKPRRDVLADITDSIIASLERGVAPWRKPWVAGRNPGAPHNAISGRNYSGVNFVVLSMVGAAYQSNGWLTYRQAQAAGGHVRAGERGVHIVYFAPKDRTRVDDSGEERTERFLMYRSFVVFNVAQCEGLKLPAREVPIAAPDVSTDVGPLQVALYNLVGLRVSYNDNQACYIPSVDAIRMPSPSQFSSLDHFRATLAHECVHATGHDKRLARKFDAKRFGDESYAAEELVAELGSAMIGARIGVDSSLLEHHASYIASWLKVLRNDKRAILTASSLAQKSCDYLVPAVAVESEDEEAIAA